MPAYNEERYIEACIASVQAQDYPRDQIEILGTSLGTDLRRSDYHKVAEGYGGRGLLLTRREDVKEVLQQAVSLARQGFPVLVNAHLDKTEFRKGSISM